MKASEVTREMGSEFELPNTYKKSVVCLANYSDRKQPYSHGNNKVGSSLLEAAPPRDESSTSIRDQCLNDEYEGDEG